MEQIVFQYFTGYFAIFLQNVRASKLSAKHILPRNQKQMVLQNREGLIVVLLK